MRQRTKKCVERECVCGGRKESRERGKEKFETKLKFSPFSSETDWLTSLSLSPFLHYYSPFYCAGKFPTTIP